MAKYTTTIDSLLQMNFNFGMQDYPIWNAEYRTILNNKILQHYRFREIGFETPALFKHYLNRTMNEIMPYYNELYATKLLEYNPLHNVDYTISHTKTIETSSTGTTSTSGTTSGESETESSGTNSSTASTTATTADTGKTVSIDTPQNAVAIGEDVNTVTHASNIGLSKNGGSSTGTSTASGSDSNTTTATTSGTNSSTSSSTGSGDETETFSQRLIGNYGVKSSQALIQETRDIIINIDMMIIEALHDLFMEVY